MTESSGGPPPDDAEHHPARPIDDDSGPAAPPAGPPPASTPYGSGDHQTTPPTYAAASAPPEQRPTRPGWLTVRNVVSAGALVLVVGGALVQYTSRAERDEDGTVVGGGDVDVMTLQVGDCLNDGTLTGEAQELSSVAAVPCDEPHTTQIMARFELTGTDYPGDAAITASADERCPDLITAALDEASLAYDLGVVSISPNEQSWESLDDREVLCGAATDEPISESLLAES